MNIFLDTNVIIGYIYSLDALHSSSRKAIVRKVIIIILFMLIRKWYVFLEEKIENILNF